MVSASSIQAVDCRILPLSQPLEPVGAKGRIGLLALATDVNSEADLRRMAPEGVEIFTNRILNANPVTMANHRAMTPDIARAAAGLLPENRLDVIAYGCTSGTVAIGEGEIGRRIEEARPGIPWTNPVAAARAGFAALGVRKLALLTPYTRDVNDAMATFLQEACGLELTGAAGFELATDEAMTAVPPQAIRAAALEACPAEAEALFISCTALRTTLILGELEAALGKPMVASNQALLWHALRLIGNDTPVAGFGRLLTLPLNG